MKLDGLSNILKEIKHKRAHLEQGLLKNHFSEEVIEKYDIEIPSSLDELLKSFVSPLLMLLVNFLKTGNTDLLLIYLDERKRFSPHLMSKELQTEFHQQLLAADYELFTSQLKSFHSVSRDKWESLHSVLLAEHPKKIRLLALGDCLMNEIRVFTHFLEKKLDLGVDSRCLYFSSNANGNLDCAKVISYISENKMDMLAVSFFSFEALPGYGRLLSQAQMMKQEEINVACSALLSTVKQFLFEFRALSTIPILLHGVSGLPLSRWRKYISLLPPFSSKAAEIVAYLNTKIQQVAGELDNCILINEQDISLAHGLRACSRPVVSQRKYGGFFHTTSFGKYLSTIYLDHIHSYSVMRKCKILLLDFDNTLWSGVMVDEEVQHYIDKQTMLKKLKNQGILLAAVSKNAIENIRWNEMVLQQEDFAILKINWNSKAQSVQEIAEALNLGKDSFVFIDDNRHERELVANAHPSLVILDSDEDQTWHFVERLLHYPNTQSTEEAKKRTLMYQEQAQRNVTLQTSVAIQSNLNSLKLWYKYNYAGKADIERILELLNRTNQFNLTVKRYSKAEVLEFLADPLVKIITYSLGDKFGSLGVVAVVIYRKLSESEIDIDSFVMSCRAMGFSLEKEILKNLTEYCISGGLFRIKARYVPTDRNTPCANLYKDMGFAVQHDGTFEYDLSKGAFKNIEWLSLSN